MIREYCWCGRQTTYWVVAKPPLPHAYKVMCGECGRGWWWGTEAQYGAELASGNVVHQIACVPSSAFEKFVSWRREKSYRVKWANSTPVQQGSN